ncbi:MAG: hypothetical protein K9K93_04560 [Acholeplasmataceae bacterium]|nr:hypothetical protein [Acholeplasmataceae bacterium]
MKKLAFGLTMMLSGAIITAGAMIGGGLEIGGRNAGSGTWYTIADSSSTGFIALGLLIFIVGLIVAVIALFQRTIVSNPKE